MRITGGEWGSRTVLVPKSELVRPTQDRVREALFSMLMHDVPGARFLDLFAGSGAVGLDALSRGAAEARFVEGDRKVFATLQKNLAAFGVGPEAAVWADVMRWVSNPPRTERPFDIVFADPPYLWAAEGGLPTLAGKLFDSGLLKTGGLLVLECDFRTDPADLPGCERFRDREYGKTKITVYRYTGKTQA